MASDQDSARVAVVTGASSGIGLVAAKALAAQGWHVIALGRNPERSRAAEVEIRAAAADGARVDMLRADLSLLSEAARVADEIVAKVGRVDVLLNNAGGANKDRVITAEGNEATFAGNHLGHFVLTNRLLPLLRAAAATSAPGATRIVNVSSKAHSHIPGIDWDDLQRIETFVAMPAYCNAKLANILFTGSLAARLADDGIVAHAMHPGVIDTNFASYLDGATQDYLRELPDHKTPEEGADTLVWLATAPEPGESSGDYFYQRQVIPTSEAGSDMAAAEQLWRESERLVAIALG